MQKETIVMLGRNGMGKSTLIKILANALKPDDTSIELPSLEFSYKPQLFSPKFKNTVYDLFCQKLGYFVWHESNF